MSQEKTSIFVEGKEDYNFLKSYMDHLRCGECEINNIEGKDKLRAQCNIISSKLHKGARVLIVFDADDDYRRTKSKIEETLEKAFKEMEVEKTKDDIRLFLFPDNKNKGRLEDLLEKIIKPEHKDIFQCFKDYKKCLKEKNTSYRPPNKKAKIHAYKLALGAYPKNPFGSDYWDFESPSLRPIKDFITENFSQ